MLRTSFLVGAIFGTLCLGGCDGQAPVSEGVERARDQILGGEPSGPEDDAVVLVRSIDEGMARTCTGTLIAENLIITARHCVSNFEDGTFSCDADGNLSSGGPEGQVGTLLPPADISIRLGAKPAFTGEPAALGVEIFSTQTTSICRNDIALVLLDRNISGISFPAIRTSTGITKGDLIRAVGYGVDDVTSDVDRNARAGLRVAYVGASPFESDPDPIAPRTFMTQGAALCPGDSGGPAFAESGALVGVWSQVVGDCHQTNARNIYTQVPPFAEGLIFPAFEAAGAEPILEGSGGMGGTGGTGGGTAEGGAGGEAAGGTDAGAPGTGGSGGSDTGGSGGTGPVISGGTAGRIGAGGSTGTAGSDGEAGEGAAGRPTYAGLRKPGGCRCDVVGARNADGGWGAVLVSLLALVFARRRNG